MLPKSLFKRICCYYSLPWILIPYSNLSGIPFSLFSFCLVTNHTPILVVEGGRVLCGERQHDISGFSISDSFLPLLASHKLLASIPISYRKSSLNLVRQWLFFNLTLNPILNGLLLSALNSSLNPILSPNEGGAKLYSKLTLQNLPLTTLVENTKHKIPFKERGVFFVIECKLLKGRDNVFLYVLLCLVHCKCSINIDDGRQ